MAVVNTRVVQIQNGPEMYNTTPASKYTTYNAPVHNTRASKRTVSNVLTMLRGL